MWLARPVYESLPYVYAAAGLAGLTASWLIRQSVLSIALLVCGALGVTVGIVLWLRRRDFRSQWAQYNSRSLDELT
jgi:hypothetical protein